MPNRALPSLLKDLDNQYSQLHVFPLTITVTTSERPLLVRWVILNQWSQLIEGACKGFFILKKQHKCTWVYFSLYLGVFLPTWSKSPSSSNSVTHTKCTVPEMCLLFSQQSSVSYNAISIVLSLDRHTRNPKHGTRSWQAVWCHAIIHWL